MWVIFSNKHTLPPLLFIIKEYITQMLSDNKKYKVLIMLNLTSPLLDSQNDNVLKNWFIVTLQDQGEHSRHHKTFIKWNGVNHRWSRCHNFQRFDVKHSSIRMEFTHISYENGTAGGDHRWNIGLLTGIQGGNILHAINGDTFYDKVDQSKPITEWNSSPNFSYYWGGTCYYPKWRTPYEGHPKGRFYVIFSSQNYVANYLNYRNDWSSKVNLNHFLKWMGFNSRWGSTMSHVSSQGRYLYAQWPQKWVVERLTTFLYLPYEFILTW